MAKDTAQLEKLIGPSITAMGYEWVGCVFVPRGRNSLLRIYIDSIHGITVDDCERVSRQVGAVLDVEDPISGSYTLEVSSPGLDRPLFTLAHYKKFIGAKINIKLHVPMENRKHLQGTIVSVTDGAITINTEDKIFELTLANIMRANLVPQLGHVAKHALEKKTPRRRL